jgi:purine-nucleoside phosphorylase
MFIGENPIHINAEKGSIAELVLMPGDPLRAKYIGEHFLENAKEVCNLRNMLGYTGFYKGVRVSVVGSGMGMPSMGIYSWELFHYFNVKKIIRIGTCGVVSPEVNVPDLILANSAYSESNFAYTFNDYKEHITYPSKELNNTIINTAKELNYKLHVGDITTMDVFGPYIDYDRVLNRMPKYLNVLGEEMEAFGLFHIASSFNREASCIVTAVDSKFSDVVLSGEERQNSLNEMITLALESIIK